MRIFKVSASIPYADGNYTLEDLGLDEDATEEEIEEVIKEMVMQHLDWGYTEIEEE